MALSADRRFFPKCPITALCSQHHNIQAQCLSQMSQPAQGAYVWICLTIFILF